jgi:putative transposase
MAEENRSWGYDRIVGVLANLEFEVSDQTVGNVLRRHGVPRAAERKRTTTWQAFIRTHLALLAGTDFLTAEVLTLRGLATYYADPAAAIGRSRKPRKTLRVPVMPTHALR